MIEIFAPFGAFTVSRLIRAPPGASAPAKRTFGNGRRILRLLIDEAPATPLEGLTTTLTNVTSVLPSSSVTLRPTRCVPTELKLADAVAPVPSLNALSPLRSHASEAILPSLSFEVDVNVTAWPTSGDALELATDAVGGRLPGTITRLPVATPPSASVTRRPIVRAPVVVKRARRRVSECVVVLAVAVEIPLLLGQRLVVRVDGLGRERDQVALVDDPRRVGEG